MKTSYDAKPELRYGAPSCERILFNRHFTVGYSDYFRQAKWSLEIVGRNRELTETERLNDFRPDFRIPRQFRASLSDYQGSGYDRGHLVPSADHDASNLENSETFLLSNMSPQAPDFNRKIWRKLETAVRELDALPNVLETYVISGPVFDFVNPMKLIGSEDEVGLHIPVPSHFFKSILAEYKNGSLKLWTFEMENKALEGDLSDYLISTYEVEQRIGGILWNTIEDRDIHEQKNKAGRMW